MRTFSPRLHAIRGAAWRAAGAKYLWQHPHERQLVRGNRDLHGRHQGDRCFILGNGPSLGDEDLAQLAGETVITVNNLVARSVGAPEPTYHVISDRRFFSVDPSVDADRAVFDTLWDIIGGDVATDRQPPITFAPSSEYAFFDRHAQGRSHGVHFFCNPFYFSDSYQISADLAGVIPRFSSVVQHAIVLAIAMGFDRIYLLGCDTTNIVANVSTALSESAADSYAYAVSPDLDAWLQRQFAKRDMERCAESFLEVLVAFRFMADYCRSRGVELVNCSSRTIVDSIPRARLREIL